jgi:hypothetical protein
MISETGQGIMVIGCMRCDAVWLTAVGWRAVRERLVPLSCKVQQKAPSQRESRRNTNTICLNQRAARRSHVFSLTLGTGRW